MRQPSRTHALLLAALALSCGRPPTALHPELSPHASGPATQRAVAQPGGFVIDPELDGLRMKLRSIDGGTTTAGAATKRAQTTPLSAKRTAALLSRLAKPPLPAQAVEFKVRKGSPPPPRTGSTVDMSLGAGATSTEVKPSSPGAAGPLRVLRQAPEGKVTLAPHASLTFSAPMVAVSSHGALSDAASAGGWPATIEPQPPGRFRWLGNRTLLFDPEGRFPMSTRYRVSVPKGTKAADGSATGAMPEAHRFEFETGRLTLRDHLPGRTETTDLQPVITLSFDQRIDVQALLPHVHVRVAGKALSLRPASPAEIDADAERRRAERGRDAARKEQDDPGRMLALLPSEPLPPASTVQVRVAKGAPSAEGPLTTQRDQTFEFKTRAPLGLQQAGCERDRARCELRQPIALRFNNRLAQPLPPGLVQVTPSMGTLRIRVVGDTLTIDGDARTAGTHEVSVGAALTDSYGQRLGTPVRATIEVYERAPQPPYPQLQGPAEPVVTLSPGTHSLPLASAAYRSLDVTIHRVSAADFPAYQRLRPRRHGKQPLPPLPGTLLFRGDVAVKRVDRMQTTEIDLAPYFPDGRGHLLVRVEASAKYDGHRVDAQVMHWVQASDIGLVALSDRERLLVWATRLSSGAPIEGAMLSLPPDRKAYPTDAEGMSLVPMQSVGAESVSHLIVRNGTDWALLPRSAHGWGQGWEARPMDVSQQVFTFDDRGLYKPGETAHVKGFVRSFDPEVGGDLGPADPKLQHLDWKLIGPRGNALGKGRARVGSHGGFAVDVALPRDMNLGHAQLELLGQGIAHGRPLHVQEFRRPRFEVEATARRPEVVLGDEAIVDLSARYYAGGGLPDAAVGYEATATDAVFRPAGLERFSFGPWRRDWWALRRHPETGGESQSLTGITDSRGEHHLGIHMEAINPPATMRVSVRAQVTDVDRQRWDAEASVLVHPSQTYVGLAAARSFIDLGEPLRVDTLVVDPGGKPQADVAATVVLSRVTHVEVDDRWEEELVEPVACQVVSADEPVACEFAPRTGGAYVLDATVTDALGRPGHTQLRIWVNGDALDRARPPTRLELQHVQLIPERTEYQPGQTARFLVQAPFYPAHGMLTVERSGIVSHRAFALEGPTRALEVAVKSEHIPNFHVSVELVGTVGPPGPRPRVVHASGTLSFDVPPLERTLSVAVRPARKRLRPGDTTRLSVDVHDARGAPLRDASVVLMAVDEAVLSLADYRRPDPLGAFYRAREAGVQRRRQRSGIPAGDIRRKGALGAVLEGSGIRTMSGSAVGAATLLGQRAGLRTRSAAAPSGSQAATGGAVRVRSEFAAAALFAPDVRTDAQGHAEIEVKLPDSLTRYRVTAVAVDRNGSFGTAEASVTAALPLRIQPSAPRFANFGDRFELPIVLHNSTDVPSRVELALRGDNATLGPNLAALQPGAATTMGSSLGLSLVIPANDRVEVRIPTATQRAGQALLQVVAVADSGDADATDIGMPVYTPSTAEAFATHGELTDDAHRLPVEAPADVWPRFGGLSVSTSSTQLQALTDALLYVVNYPYACNEQLASRVLSVLSLRDVLRAFEVPGLPSEDELDAMVDADLETLAQRQHADGGFGFWTSRMQTDPYVSVHVGAALALAKQSGRRVPQRMLGRSADYLAQIRQRTPKHYGVAARNVIESYALAVRSRLGTPDPARARALWKQHGAALPIEAMGFVLPTLDAAGMRAEVSAILRALDNRVTETAGAAHFTTHYEDGAFTTLHSTRRSDAVVLDALLQVRPQGDLNAKLVRGLLGHRVQGRWGSTQENTFVLQALNTYFRKHEGVTPDFLARVWLGDDLSGEHRFSGRTTKRAALEIPMHKLLGRGGPLPLTLARGGEGRMYYRVGLRYAPRDLNLDASDHGFAVGRSYRAIDDPDDVIRLADGSWRIRLGARVEVEVELAAESVRHHVALVDPLPAGFEPRNPALASDGALPDPEAPALRRGSYWWWTRTWYEHQNMRDERVEAFASALHAGVHSYRYVARATTPGQFVVPPARAEEMYSPETFGRSDSDRVVIE